MMNKNLRNYEKFEKEALKMTTMVTRNQKKIGILIRFKEGHL